MANKASAELMSLEALGPGKSPTSFRSEMKAAPPSLATIAIVEDEPELLSVFSRVIARLGYPNPATFTDGTSLVKTLATDHVSFDLILMDHGIPEMDGIEAGRLIRRYRPNMKIILSAAYESIRPKALESALMFLQKPFSVKELSPVLQRALASEESACFA